MDKELDAIAQVTSTGELRGKLLEADEAKVEIEAILLKRVKFNAKAVILLASLLWVASVNLIENST